MKIAMFTDYFFPELGGIQDSIAIMSAALGRRGHQIDIYAPRYGERDYRKIGVEIDERNLGDNVRVHRRPSLPFPSSTQQSRAGLLSPIGWAKLAGRAKPDVIHTHSFFGVGLEALLNGTCLRVPVVGTNHTTIAGFGPHLPISVGSASAYVAWFYNRCDCVTAPSCSVFQELGPERLRRPQRVISNPIDTGLFAPARADERNILRAKWGLSYPTITYAGRLGPEKNIDVLLHAVAMLRDHDVSIELAICGHGSHEPVLKALAAELRIDEQVRFLGTLAQDRLAQLLRVSDIFAIMSTSETQSMVMLQAMASGIPVVAAATRALPEFVGPANGVLVDPHDAAQLSQVLADLLASPEHRRQMGAAGRQIAQRSSIESVTDSWESIYRSMREGSPIA